MNTCKPHFKVLSNRYILENALGQGDNEVLYFEDFHDTNFVVKLYTFSLRTPNELPELHPDGVYSHDYVGDDITSVLFIGLEPMVPDEIRPKIPGFGPVASRQWAHILKDIMNTEGVDLGSYFTAAYYTLVTDISQDDSLKSQLDWAAIKAHDRLVAQSKRSHATCGVKSMSLTGGDDIGNGAFSIAPHEVKQLERMLQRYSERGFHDLTSLTGTALDNAISDNIELLAIQALADQARQNGIVAIGDVESRDEKLLVSTKFKKRVVDIAKRYLHGEKIEHLEGCNEVTMRAIINVWGADVEKYMQHFRDIGLVK